MRVLIVTQYFWPEQFRINDLVQGLTERGHSVTVLTGKPNYPGGRFMPGYGFLGRACERYGEAEVCRVPLIPRGKGGGVGLLLNYASFALFASLLGPGRCAGRFDLILVYEPSPVTVGLPALVMKVVKRAPVMFWVQDLWPESLSATGAVRSAPVLRLVEQLVRFIYRHCDQILVQSLAFRQPIERLGVAPERLAYFPNSAEALYRPVQRADAQLPVPLPTGFRLMFAGNIGAAQSFETILGAAELLRGQPDIHLIIVGHGRQFNWVQDEVWRRGLGASVHLVGQHPVETMPTWFASADAMLVTLRRKPIFAYTIPSKVQSYMACARPIVAALDGEGARVVLEAGAGLAVGAEDSAALADAVLEMYRMPRDQREAMGQRGRKYFLEQFERGMLIERLDGWMRSLAARKPA